MIRFVFISLISLSVLSFFSCGDNEKIEENDEKDLSVESSGELVVPQDSRVSVQVIDGAKLADYLPTSIPGCEKSPVKIGEIDDGEEKISVVSREYIFPNNGFLKYSITDYGEYKFIPDYEIRLFASPPVEDGKDTEEFVISDSKGYLLWDNKAFEGMLFVMVSKRFILRIDATRLPKSSLKLQDYVKYYKIKELKESL